MANALIDAAKRLRTENAGLRKIVEEQERTVQELRSQLSEERAQVAHYRRKAMKGQPHG